MSAAKPMVLIGGGGHGAVVAELARACGYELAGVIDPDEDTTRATLPGILFLSADDNYLRTSLNPAEVCIGVGIGGAPSLTLRGKVYAFARSLGYDVPPLVHPFTAVASGVRLGVGAQVMMGACIQPRATIGEGCIINTRAGIDHDCSLGDNVHVAPGATLCGAVTVGAGSFIGAGATVIQGTTIGTGCVVGAGAVVLSDVADGQRVTGCPARPIKRY
jgi:sugar O-acyltransferase (sialic acid O-acetyltransferase NeuD family)